MTVSEKESSESTITLGGTSIIGFSKGKRGNAGFRAFDPSTGRPCEPEFSSATSGEIDRAVELAAAAAPQWAKSSGATRSKFLRAVASGLENVIDPITQRAHLETGLPMGRLKSEMGRTCAQIRLFADVLEDGSWVMARIDHADPARTPLPKPDVRSMLRPLGPVVVFGASNFPLAFSVAGGDTVSAWAAGNPVIVKAHPAHPGTSELVGRVVSDVVRSLGLHEGLFSLLFDSGTAVGRTLVLHAQVKAVGFTGSLAGGRALMDLAASRPEPIPVFAEMGSINPVFILPRALEKRGDQIVAGLYGSFTLGGGQFCTKPGVVFLPNASNSDDFVRRLEEQVSQAAPFTLLTTGIRNAFLRGRDQRKSAAAVRTVASSNGDSVDESCRVGPVLMHTDIKTFLTREDLAEELFGPATLLVSHSKKSEVLEAAANLKGHLTATVHGTDEDFAEFADLISILETKVGRLVFNGYPTGVELGHAMVHGGPYPATSDGRSTSVGTEAILRFSRPVCFQDCPNEVLPPELKNENPLGIWRMIEGRMTREQITRK